MSKLTGIILAGGQSSRMGEDKALMMWSGRRAIDHVVDLAYDAGAGDVIVAGRDYGYPFLVDHAVYGGPARAVFNCARRLPHAQRCLVLAVDAPLITFDDLKPLLSSGYPGAAYRDQPLPIVAARSALLRTERARSLLQLVEQAGLALLPLHPDAIRRVRGANTPEEVAEFAYYLEKSG